MSKTLSTLLLIFTLFSTALLADPILNIEQPIRTLKISDEQMKNAIVNAAQAQNWIVTPLGDGQLSATYRKRDYMAKISIRYAPTFYTINYADSVRMSYKGNSIHPTYNKLIKALQLNIISNLKSGNFATKSAAATASTAVTSQSCESSFKIEGDLWKGRTFHAARNIDNILKDEAVTQAAAIVMTEGFVINSSSPELGLISASETKSDGSVLPLNLMFSETDTGVLGKLTVSTPSGVSSSADAMRDYMCGLLKKIKPTGHTRPKAQEQTAVTATKAAPAAPKDDIRSKLEKIKKLYEDGLITKDEYSAKRKSLIEAY